MPNITTSSKSKPNSYGTWQLPSRHSHDYLHKRQISNQEEPLEPEPSVTTHAAASLSSNLGSSSSSSSSSPNTTTLAGILPQCFPSLSACQAMTRNCTGHGACALKYTDRDIGSGARCYSCQCTADVRTNADGTKKTTGWGGPACQKKDVVAPFWLLAGFSIFFVALLSWGVGTIWTMGDEELPSVIGAGVSGVPSK